VQRRVCATGGGEGELTFPVLCYQDDWYIISSSMTGDPETDHVFIYYRGSNDAWDGYGGATGGMEFESLSAASACELEAS